MAVLRTLGLAFSLFSCILYTLVHGQGISQKRGVCHWADNFMCNDFEVLNNMNFWYDWRCNLDYFHNNNICSSVIDNYKSNYLSMIWGFYPNTDYACYTSETSAVLGINEPNHQAQSNLSPQEAAAYWPTMEAHAGTKVLVSPSAAPCGENCNGNTTEWLDQFFQACPNCRVDKLATHTYWCNVNQTMDFLESLYIRYQKPIWLTEFACRHEKNKAARVLRFMEGILPRLEAAPYIEKYAWYMARIPDNSSWVKTSASLFLPGSSVLTPLGEFYNTYVYNGTV